MKHFAIAFAAWIGYLASRCLGPDRSSALFGFLLASIGPSHKAHAVARRNIEQHLGVHDIAAQDILLRGAWENLGRTIGELPHARWLADNHVTVKGHENLVRARASGRGIVFVAAHMANWELLAPSALPVAPPLLIFYRAPTNVWLDKLLRRLRRNLATDVAAKNSMRAQRLAFSYLMRGGSVGFLVDQASMLGIRSKFFGVPVHTSAAPARLALKCGAAVIPVNIVRTSRTHFQMTFEAEIPLPEGGTAELNAAILTDLINLAIERWVRKQPDQWLWMHRRWR